MAMTDIELDVELLKKEVSDMKEIHGRLDTAITTVSYTHLTLPTKA